MRHTRNKTTPKVVNGRVQKKNSHVATANYWNTTQNIPLIDKEAPGKGYRHLLRKKDIFAFIELLPDWDETSNGLDAVLLARGESGLDGWYSAGVIGICAWDRDLWIDLGADYYEDHKDIFARLGVHCLEKDNYFECQFTESQAKAYQLLHIFLHEFGHHHDRMTSKIQQFSGRGENYAEQYALQYEKNIWDQYFDVFGI